MAATIFKRVIKDLTPVLQTLDQALAVPRYSEEFVETQRESLSRCQKLLRDLEVEWSLLPSTEKNHYKAKLLKHRSKYETLRSRFFQLEDQQVRMSAEQHSAV